MQGETPPQSWIFVLIASCRSVTLHQHLKLLRFSSEEHSGPSTDLVKCTKMGWNPKWMTRFCLSYIQVSFQHWTKRAESGPEVPKILRAKAEEAVLALPTASFLLMQLQSCSIPQIEVHTFSPSELAYFCSLVFRNKSPSLPGRDYSHAINISMRVSWVLTFLAEECGSLSSSDKPGWVLQCL